MITSNDGINNLIKVKIQNNRNFFMNKIILLGILFQCLNTLSGSTLDTITKFLGSKSYTWYHYYSIGNIFTLIILFIFLHFNGGIKKHIFLKKKTNYYIPVMRGLTFIPLPIIIFFALKHIPLNVFTVLFMTVPFFMFIFSQLLQKEKVTYINWIVLILGFFGVVLVIKPDPNQLNIYFFLVLYLAAYVALMNIVVSKYSHLATTYGYTFYQFLPFTLCSSFIFFLNPMLPELIDLLLICSAGLLFFLAALFYNTTYYIAGKYTGIVSPFVYTQIIWASLYGYIFFSEKLDYIAVIGIVFIVISGSISIRQTKKIV